MRKVKTVNICFISFFCILLSIFLVTDNTNAKQTKNASKKYLVKYKTSMNENSAVLEHSSKKEDNDNNNKKELKNKSKNIKSENKAITTNNANKDNMKNHKKINKHEVYVVEGSESELNELMDSNEVELVEEDSEIYLLTESTDNIAPSMEHNHYEFEFCEDDCCQHEHDENQHEHESVDIYYLCTEPCCENCTMEKDCCKEQQCCENCICGQVVSLENTYEFLEFENEEETTAYYLCATPCCENCTMEKDCCKEQRCCENCICGLEVDFDHTYDVSESEGIEHEEGPYYLCTTPCCENCTMEKDCCKEQRCCENCVCGQSCERTFQDIWYQTETCCGLCSDNCVYETCCEACHYASKTNLSGDELPWNVLHTKAEQLHNNGITGQNIKVAVFDTGIDLNHSDLTVVGGISLIEGVDSYTDDHGHGTLMASIIASSINGSGLAGIAPDVELYSVKVLDSDGVGHYSNIIEGIDWAIDNNINIIALSLGGTQYSQILSEAINRAVENNILIIAAAGNSGLQQKVYPAAYPQVVCVGAVNVQNELVSFSNYGNQLDLVAPGKNVIATGLGNSRVIVNGTSPAASQVAGAAALLWSSDTNLTNGSIKYLLYQNAYHLGAYENYGHGLVNVESAYKAYVEGKNAIYVEEDSVQVHLEEIVVGWDGVIFALACDHKYIKEEVSATCTTDGYSVTYCQRCGSTGGHAKFPKLGHKYVSESVSASCTTDGYKRTYCTRCGLTSSYTRIPAPGHSKKSESVSATCTTDGYSRTYCTKCGTTFSFERIPAPGHSKKSESVSATCTTDGYSRTYCTRCGLTSSYTRFPKPGHKEKSESISATCTSDGYIIDYCGECGTTFSVKIIPSPGHKEKSEFVSATCTTDGYRKNYCSICGYISSLIIEKAWGHYCYEEVSTVHTSQGHSISRNCGYCYYGSFLGYQRLSTCLSCTTPPSIRYGNLSANQVLTETSTAFLPQIIAQDNENDTLSCSYYMDGSSTAVETINISNTRNGATVGFTKAINISQLTEGNHTIKVVARDPIAPEGSASLTFRVDKTAPKITSITPTISARSVTLMVAASDTISGLHAAAYRYTINGTVSQWISSTSYTQGGLLPNTFYQVKVEVRDAAGHIAIYDGSLVTKLEAPSLTTEVLSEQGLRIKLQDNNNAATCYSVKIGNSYITEAGLLTSTETYLSRIAMENGRIITIMNGLASNTSYSVVVTAKSNNTQATLTETTLPYKVSQSTTTGTTTPAIPTELSVVSKTNTSISLGWVAQNGANTYQVSRCELSEDGQTISEKILTSMTSYYVDSDLIANTSYQYKVRSVKQGELYSAWSSPICETTIPNPPARIMDLQASCIGNSVALTWSRQPRDVGYQVELSYDGNIITEYTANSSLTYPIGYDMPCSIKVRAYNIANPSDPYNTQAWKNGGEWSDSVELHTPANKPLLLPVTDENISHASILVHWEPTDNPDTVTYIVNVQNGQLTEQVITDINQNHFKIEGLSDETEYQISVKAVNSLGLETEASNFIFVTTKQEKPSIPTKLRASVKSDQVRLQWEASAKAMSYQIMRNGILIATDYSDTYYLDSNVEPNTEYQYQIQAMNRGGESGWSQNITKKTPGKISAIPSNFTAVEQVLYVELTWDEVSDALAYDIEIDGFIYNMGSNLSYQHNGLEGGSTHNYRIRSRNENGKSEWSDALVVKTTPILPRVPSNLLLQKGLHDIYITWDGVEEADSYEIDINSAIITGVSGMDYLYQISPEEIETVSGAAISVRAINDGGTSEWSLSQYVSFEEVASENLLDQLQMAGTPVFTSIDVIGQGIQVQWASVPYATIYQLEINDVIVYTGAKREFYYRNMVEGEIYQLRICAGNLKGYSEWSEIREVSLPSIISYTPELINYYRTTDGQLEILWSEVTGITDYLLEVNHQIYGSTIQGQKATLQLEAEQQYDIRVASVYYEGDEVIYDWSEELSILVPAPIPQCPEGFMANTTQNQISLSWTPVEEATGYIIDLDGIIYRIGKEASYQITGLDENESYSCRLRSYNESGESAWSESVTLMTQQTAPKVPLNISCKQISPVNTVSGSAVSLLSETSSVSGSAIRRITEENVVTGSAISVSGSALMLRWNEVEGATGYEVEINQELLVTIYGNELYLMDYYFDRSYLFRIRALSGEQVGSWSSYIRFLPTVFPVKQVVAELHEDKVDISWESAGASNYYEVEMDGALIAITTETSISLNKEVFHSSRYIRVRAVYGDKKSNWSEYYEFHQSIPQPVSVIEGEELFVDLSASLVNNLTNYNMILTIKKDEFEIIDLYEYTEENELTSVLLMEEGIGIERMEDEENYILRIYAFGNQYNQYSFSGILNCIHIKSKITGEAILFYQVETR